MKLTKLLNGSIILISPDINGPLTRTLKKDAILQITESSGELGIYVKQGSGDRSIDFIQLSELDIEIEPNPSTPFTGTINDLFYYLSENVFESPSLESFNITPGNTVEVTYYSGVATGNPSGTTTNIETLVYKNGTTVIATKTIEYNVADGIIKITIS